MDDEEYIMGAREKFPRKNPPRTRSEKALSPEDF